VYTTADPPADLDRFLFPVGATAVVAFAEAVRDQQSVRIPLTVNDLVAGGLVPSPTFLVSTASVDPATHLRPERGRMSDADEPLHAGYHVRHHRYPGVGETLEVHSGAGEEWTRRSRDGSELRLRERRWSYRDAAGTVVATAVWLDAYTSRRPSVPDGDSVPPSPEAPGLQQVGAVSGRVHVGRQWSAVVVEELDLLHLVRYSGAAGDLVPVHFSDAAAQRYGAGGVFGQGMLSLGLGCSLLTALFGAGAVRSVDARFRSPTLVGDRLVAIARVVRQLDRSESATDWEVGLVVVNQHGTTVVQATTEIRVPH